MQVCTGTMQRSTETYVGLCTVLLCKGVRVQGSVIVTSVSSFTILQGPRQKCMQVPLCVVVFLNAGLQLCKCPPMLSAHRSNVCNLRGNYSLGLCLSKSSAQRACVTSKKSFRCECFQLYLFPERIAHRRSRSILKSKSLCTEIEMVHGYSQLTLCTDISPQQCQWDQYYCAPK